MPKAISANEMKKSLNEAGVYPAVVSKKAGVYTTRFPFFYTHGKSSEGYAEKIRKAVSQAEIVGHIGIWKTFRGGASVADQSHFRVDFVIREKV